MKPPVEAYRFTSRLVALEAGLHGIRYLSTGQELEPPSIMVQALPVDADAVDYLPSPGGTPGCLVAPGEMLVLRAHRNVHVVTTIVSTAELVKNDGLQLRVERLDRASLMQAKGKTAGGELTRVGRSRRMRALPSAPAALEKPAAEAVLEMVSAGPAVASKVSAAAAPAMPAPSSPAPAPWSAPAEKPAAAAVRLPNVAVGILTQGSRSWQMGTLSALPDAANKVVIGVRLAVREDRASTYQLKLVASLSDGRTREAWGPDVRAEAMGSNSIVGIAAQYRGPDNSEWSNLCNLNFSLTS